MHLMKTEKMLLELNVRNRLEDSCRHRENECQQIPIVDWHVGVEYQLEQEERNKRAEKHRQTPFERLLVHRSDAPNLQEKKEYTQCWLLVGLGKRMIVAHKSFQANICHLKRGEDHLQYRRGLAHQKL